MKLKIEIGLFSNQVGTEAFYHNRSELTFKQVSPTKDIIEAIAKATKSFLVDVIDYEDFYVNKIQGSDDIHNK